MSTHRPVAVSINRWPAAYEEAFWNRLLQAKLDSWQREITDMHSLTTPIIRRISRRTRWPLWGEITR